MPRYRTAYPQEFRRQMVDLVRSGRTPEELAREFEPTAQSISTWVKQAERTPASALMGRQALSVRNWGAFDVRTIACVRSATSSQRRQPGSRGRERSTPRELPLDKQKGVRGSQYTSVAFGARCKEAGVRPSTGSVGDAYDNAMCESFFATLKCELIDRRHFRSHSEARMAVFQFIEGFYNPSRRHSALGYSRPSNTKGNVMA